MNDQETVVRLDPDGIIFERLSGPITPEYMATVSPQLIALADQRKQANRPVFILLDASGITDSNADGRKSAVAAIDKAGYTRIALFGAKPYIKFMGGFVTKAIGKSSAIKFFGTESDARKWLLS